VSGNASHTLTFGTGSFLVGQGVPSVWDSLTDLSVSPYSFLLNSYFFLLIKIYGIKGFPVQKFGT
jgi:hypothetical protein